MWHIGQDIVAISNHPKGKFKEGDTFVIKALQECRCKCGGALIDIGIGGGPYNSIGCTICKAEYMEFTHIHWVHERNFSPLDSIADISELTEVLNQPAFS